ncbi:hypothetical protein J8F10_00435 [Gemmata sp. G18]|uniref:MFS transporter n=1 Tax=Gemmata palustris TaxID=2822762 RepID=A0ABS5BJ92_9BACT|nr:hypothetical protein [Gemmata palustris]MBP3953768.1 hypothetical protein [Gemmata palustris]
MSFVSRAAIALLAGIGSGLLGFWIVWSTVWKVVGEHPGIGHDAWLLAGIFVPGIAVPILVFRSVSRAVTTRPI